METATAALRLTNWERTWAYNLEAPWDRSVSEVILETLRTIGLPIDTPYRALQRERQLPDLETLRDAGVEEGIEITLVPDVVAGSNR